MDKKVVRKIKLDDESVYYITSDTLVPAGSEYSITLPELEKDEIMATESFVDVRIAEAIGEAIAALLAKEY